MSSFCSGKFGRVGVPTCHSIGQFCALIVTFTRQPTAYADSALPLNGHRLPALGAARKAASLRTEAHMDVTCVMPSLGRNGSLLICRVRVYYMTSGKNALFRSCHGRSCIGDIFGLVMNKVHVLRHMCLLYSVTCWPYYVVRGPRGVSPVQRLAVRIFA
jgi:hypothetical protein